MEGARAVHRAAGAGVAVRVPAGEHRRVDDDEGRSRDGGVAEVHGRLGRLASALDATPAELAGLTALLLGGVVCLAVLVWWSPPGAPPAAGAVGAVPTPIDAADAGPQGSVTVHVVGAVARPGVVSLPAGARVVDAIAAAGEATLLADVGQLNLARAVTDGERIEVPERGAAVTEEAGAEGASAAGAFLADGRLDLNRATAADLETLPGIGPVLAARIVSHRDASGPFATAGALREVPGIGEATFQRLADLVVAQ